MRISEELQEFLERYYILVDENMFEGLYRKLDEEGLTSKRSELSRILTICKIDPLKYMSEALPDMFSGVDQLRVVNLPIGFRSIEERAFEECRNLRRLVLPHTIEYIDPTAFKGCFYLKEIYYFGTVADWKMLNVHDRTFLDCSAIKIVCRDGVVPN